METFKKRTPIIHLLSVNKDVLEASVIEVAKVKGAISCDDCRIEYSKEHYEILFANKKLIYFDFNFPATTYLACLCHNCLFKALKGAANGEDVSVKILHKKEEYLCKFSSEK